jgi:hypothetical protein
LAFYLKSRVLSSKKRGVIKIISSQPDGHTLGHFTAWPFLLFMALLVGLVTKTSGFEHATMAPIQGAASLVLNVKDFHATGDGKTDDTAVFAGALTKLAENGGGTLLIPPGTYVVADLNVGSGTVIKGTGSPLPVLVKRPDAKNIINILSVRYADSRGVLHDITIEQLTLRGRSVEDGFSEHIHNINALGVARLSVQHVRFEAFQGDGLYLGRRQQQNGEAIHNSDVTITDNSFDGTNNQNRNGISLIDCSHCIVERNVFTSVSRYNMPGAIDLEPNQRDEIIRDVAIRNNTITGSNGGAGAISVVLNFKDFITSPGKITIEHNQIQSSRNGIAVLWRGGMTTEWAQSLDTVIRNNVIKEVDHPMTLDGVAGITVDHNEFSASRSELQIGCSFGAFGVHFTNNRFERIGGNSVHGITLCGPAADLVFDKNAFTNLGSGQKDGSAIYFARGAATNVTFTANTFSSPAHVTRVAIRTASGVSLRGKTNTWTGNILQDRIQQGTFPHRRE